MISTSGLSLQFGKRTLFKDVNLKFTPGNCYGIIGANGAGKSTLLKLLSGAIEPTSGSVDVTPGDRIAVLQQDHYAYDDYEVLKTVMMGHKRLVEIMDEKEALYTKPEMTEEEGMRASELEAEFAELDGWNAEPEAESLLNGLGIATELHHKQMAELAPEEKVRVLLAQALFGSPDILLLDEPTNHLDVISINWLENFLGDFPNTVIVVSHDRHFLNNVCTYICDVDYGTIKLYAGNYDFWLRSSQLAMQMAKDANKKKEEKIKELKTFIQRFSANAAKSKQATSRKKLLEKITLDDIKPSSRRYPYIAFTPDREAGDQLLQVSGISKTIDGIPLLKNVSFTLKKGDKVAFVSQDMTAMTVLFQILTGEMEPDEGTFKWGVTTTQAYLPKDNSKYFDGVKLNLVAWLRQFSKDPDEEVRNNPKLLRAEKIIKDLYHRDTYRFIGEILLPSDVAFYPDKKEFLCNDNPKDEYYLTEEDIELEKCSYDYGNKNNNPFDNIFFYNPKVPNNCFRKLQRHSLLTPNVFREFCVKVICKDQNKVERAKKLFDIYKKKLLRQWNVKEKVNSVIVEAPEDSGIHYDKSGMTFLNAKRKNVFDNIIDDADENRSTPTKKNK